MTKPTNTREDYLTSQINQLKSEGDRPEIDIPTLIAIATLAWVLVNVSHEIIGHAGAAVLLGIPVRAVSTTTASIAWDQVTFIGAYRIIMAGGTVMNLVGGAAALILLRLWRRAKSATRYFLWLFSTFSFIVGFLSTAGTALMTATPFSVSPIIHKTGIGLYFFGVVVLQTMIFINEWSLKSVPRGLPLLSLAMILIYFVFVTLKVMYEQGAVSRATPVIWEWLAFSTSIAWVLAQSSVLGRE